MNITRIRPNSRIFANGERTSQFRTVSHTIKPATSAKHASRTSTWPVQITSANGLTCEPNPIGMVGCVQFKSIDKCKVCDHLHYQKNNECVKVPTLINNCEIYESETLCQLCAKQYNLLDEKCSITEIENCDVVGYNGQCEKCKDGFQVSVTSSSRTSARRSVWPIV